MEAEVIRLGRLGSNDVQLIESHVSKQHAEIRRRGEEFVVVDLASKAGVLVNGVRVDEQALFDGDLITFGATDLPNITFRLARPGARREGEGSASAAVAEPPDPNLLR